MLLLDSTQKSIEIVLGTIPGTELQWTSSYVDVTTSTIGPLASDGTTNGTTPVTMVPAPAASTQRQTKYLSVFNADSSVRSVTIRLNDNTALRTLCTFTLNPNEHLAYTDGHGFKVIAADGSDKGTVINGTGIGATAKSGAIIPGSFTGSPRVATVVFATPYPDTNYTVTADAVMSSQPGYALKVENKSTTGFDVHLGSSVISGMVEVLWQTMPVGE